MDEVDIRYRDSIREALQSQNADKLIQLVPSLTNEEAQYYIDSWTANYLETMTRIRRGQDTRDLDEQTYQLLGNLMDRAHLSRYHK